MKEVYSKDFYSRIDSGSMASAATILKIVQGEVSVGSVVDVGAGSGAWLSAARTLGISRLQAIDGPWAAAALDVKGIPFHAINFAEETSEFKPDRRFDLATCVEMAEHIPKARSDVLVGFLCSLADIVVFSAAAPGQGGDHHVNEQWPEFWATLFREHGYVCSDWLRWEIWNEESVEWWYRQNILFFVHESRFSRLSEKLQAAATQQPRPVVHPASFARFFGRAHKLAAFISMVNRRLGL